MPIEIKINPETDFDQPIASDSTVTLTQLLQSFEASDEAEQFFLLDGEKRQISVDGKKYVLSPEKNCVFICREKAHNPGKYVYEVFRADKRNILGQGSQGAVYPTKTKKNTNHSGKGNVIKWIYPAKDKAKAKRKKTEEVDRENLFSQIANPIFPPKGFSIHSSRGEQHFIVMKKKNQTLQELMYRDSENQSALCNLTAGEVKALQKQLNNEVGAEVLYTKINNNIRGYTELTFTRNETEQIKQALKKIDPALESKAEEKNTYAFRAQKGLYSDNFRNLSSIQLLTIMINIVKAIRDLHERGIVHRDLKPANIMIDENFNIDLIDFDLSKKINENRSHNVGTLRYASPEQILNSASHEKSDIFSAGIILGELLGGCPSTFSRRYDGMDRTEDFWLADTTFTFPDSLSSPRDHFEQNDIEQILGFLGRMTKGMADQRCDFGPIIQEFDLMLIRIRSKDQGEALVDEIIQGYGRGNEARQRYFDALMSNQKNPNGTESQQASLNIVLKETIETTFPLIFLSENSGINKKIIDAYLNALGIKALMGLSNINSINKKIDEVFSGFEEALSNFYDRYNKYNQIKNNLKSLYQISIYASCENKTLKNIAGFFNKNANRGEYHHPNLDDRINLTKKWEKAVKNYDENIDGKIPFGTNEACDQLKIKIIDAIRKYMDSPSWTDRLFSRGAISKRRREDVKKIYDLLMEKDITLDELKDNIQGVFNGMQVGFFGNEKENVEYKRKHSKLIDYIANALTDTAGNDESVLNRCNRDFSGTANERLSHG